MNTGMEQVASFKHQAMVRFAEAFVRLLMWRPMASTDDLSDEDRPVEADRKSVPGNALKALRQAHVIDYANDFHQPDRGIYWGRKRSERKDAKGREVRFYRLTNRGMAEAWLRANGRGVPPDGQMRFAI